MIPTVSIVWFYRDLRLMDNIALSQAASCGSILPLYILDEDAKDGAASRWWLQEALIEFDHDLKKNNLSLVLKKGNPLQILSTLAKEVGATRVTWARRYEPDLAKRDTLIAAALRLQGIEVVIQPGYLLFEPEKIKTQAGTPFKVYTPFSKACLASPSLEPPLSIPTSMASVEARSSDTLASWKLVPQSALWPLGLKAAWRVGEAAASLHLQKFLNETLADYKIRRDRPDVMGTSRMSPYLHFGHISPRLLWHAIMRHQHSNPSSASSSERYILEILWREFSWHLLHHFPDLPSEPLQKSFKTFPWRQDQTALDKWQRGATGFPIVDAGMRQLWQTGWMHNRVRMIVASFLIKDLLLDWQKGMSWFWDTLVDADLASNTASWQWVAGCGADAAPYYRIFNPTLQGLKFDPHGSYVRHFVPEIAKLDDAFIHEPSRADMFELARAGITLGKTYPFPMLDHKEARLRALEALKSCEGVKKVNKI